MKNLPFALFVLICAKTFAQSSGSIVPKEPKPRAGKENIYIYTPPKGLIVPDSINVLLLYNLNKGYVKPKKIPLVKNAGHYQFSFVAPDSTKCFVAGITNKNGKVIDARDEKGYLLYLYDDNSSTFEDAITNAAQLLYFDATYYLKLDIPGDSILAMYEDAYERYPKGKDKTYFSYLYILYRIKKDAAKPTMLQYAKEQLAINKEENLNNALNIYRLLRMDDEINNLSKKIISEYPNGFAATNALFDSIYQLSTPEEKIAVLNANSQKFNEEVKNRLYTLVVEAYEQKKDWDKYLLYSDSISSALQIASIYNNTAWHLSGEDVNNPGENLEFAKIISKKSIDIITDRMNNPEKYTTEYNDIEDFKQELKGNYDMNIDTYALILYKLNQPDSAFYYEDLLIRNTTDIGNFERYATYAAKVKGNEFAKAFLEDKFLQGYSSQDMKTQLKEIYQQLNLSDAGYNTLIAKSNTARIEKIKAELAEKMMNKPAKPFNLKNLQGQTVSLASLKGKVVVVDFWATWCGPCKASFPGMQQTLNKYKDDKEVVFLFVDTWEHKEPKQMQEDAQAFINSNKYTFTVLLDTDDKTISEYKVEGIPTKFIIDKEGKIRFESGGYNSNLDAMADEISLMIDMAKNQTMM